MAPYKTLLKHISVVNICLSNTQLYYNSWRIVGIISIIQQNDNFADARHTSWFWELHCHYGGGL